MKSISRMLGFKEVKEVMYLGIKIALRRLRVSSFLILLEQDAGKLNIWRNWFISLDGKLLLIESFFLSLLTFLSSHSLVPKGVLEDLDRMCRVFLWNKKDIPKDYIMSLRRSCVVQSGWVDRKCSRWLVRQVL